MDPSPTATTVTVDPKHVTYTHLMYALHAASVITGILTAASIVGWFLTGWTSIIAVIMNYLRRGEVRGTWLDSHFSWQLRTFWWALAWAVACGSVFGLLSLILIGIPFLIASMFLIGIWVAYRILKGWLALRDGRTVG